MPHVRFAADSDQRADLRKPTLRAKTGLHPLTGNSMIAPRLRYCLSFRTLSPHMEVRVEELQRDLPGVGVQFGAVHARSIVAGFGKVIPPDLVALIVEDFVADQTRQYIQLRMRDV